jgi:hypothetical protein
VYGETSCTDCHLSIKKYLYRILFSKRFFEILKKLAKNYRPLNIAPAAAENPLRVGFGECGFVAEDGTEDSYETARLASNNIRSYGSASRSFSEGWDQDAKYFYYSHGPLARVEHGDNKVQAMDYAYTLQGWVKGINSTILDAAKDIGRDGDLTAGNINRNIGRDAMSYSLAYYNNDYSAVINANNNFIASTTAAAYLATDAPGLFNGNISHMVLWIWMT